VIGDGAIGVSPGGPAGHSGEEECSQGNSQREDGNVRCPREYEDSVASGERAIERVMTAWRGGGGGAMLRMRGAPRL
jgi:hypothetical protein